MRSVLHGTWLGPPSDGEHPFFFLWAEGGVQQLTPARDLVRVQRHPAGATAIAIADLLRMLAPGKEWHNARRLTRVVLLPTADRLPLVPRWLVETGPAASTEPPQLHPWRVEGLGLPMLGVLELLVGLPRENHQIAAAQRLGSDLRFWGLVTKFCLEMLAGQRFLPALRAEDDMAHAWWQLVADAPDDSARLEALVKGMPDACRAVTRERTESQPVAPHSARAVLESFVHELIDGCVRTWAGPPTSGLVASSSARFTPDDRSALGKAWWRALRTGDGQMRVPSRARTEVTRFHQSWQTWVQRAAPDSEASFRICFRLEPPDLGPGATSPTSTSWTLRYFLQAHDDPSLLVPAHAVWMERGETLSYLNRRFDHPQDKLLEGLGIAARFCAPVRRSLSSQHPESITLGSQEIYTFLRETTHLLQESGFGVLAPPWWTRGDARLRARVQLTSGESSTGARMGLGSLVHYDWQLALGDETLSRDEFEQLAALKTPLVQVRGRWVLLQPDQVEAAIRFWEKRQLQGDATLGTLLPLALGVDGTLDGVEMDDPELSDDLAELVGALKDGARFEPVDPPEGLEGELRPYQSLGLAWLVLLRKWGLGACLADDMGLGKTIQAIALMLHQRELDAQCAPALVVCPTSVVGNWRREVERFAPSLRTVVHHGVGRAEGSDFVAQSKDSDLVISTYGLVRRDIDDLRQVRWSTVILDEAQNIKNPVTKQARAVRRLIGDHRVALTGTPVENRLSELWSIMSFLNPGYLGTHEGFRRSFSVPIERFREPEAVDRLRHMVRPFILRRLKTDPKVIQDLPDKFEYRVYCTLTREQATLYEAIVQDALRSLAEPGGQNGIRRRGLVLAMLTRLKQICNHPALYLGDGSRLAGRSGKLSRLSEMLEEALEVGDRALVFTQYAQMGRLLQSHLQDTFGTEVLFLHGGTPQKQRDAMLTRFQADDDAPSIFVLSLKAGGTGLNLMRANHVFHYDRWWNPAVENQATDRAYRIGQTRDVQVHKFICVGTLEERIDEVIESKRELAENVVGSGESWLTELSSEALREIVALRAAALEGN